MKARSACARAVLRSTTRGSAIAFGSGSLKSIRLTSVCITVPGIVEPPGEPMVMYGLPSRSTIVGAIELRGRLLPSARLAVLNVLSS